MKPEHLMYVLRRKKAVDLRKFKKEKRTRNKMLINFMYRCSRCLWLAPRRKAWLGVEVVWCGVSSGDRWQYY